MVLKEETQILIQLIKVIEEAEEKLEVMYFQRNLEGFENAKKFILNAQTKIDKIIK